MPIRVLLIPLFLLASCSDKSDRSMIILKNKETGQTVQCETRAWTLKMYTDVENCAKAYEKAGYERVSDYKN